VSANNRAGHKFKRNRPQLAKLSGDNRCLRGLKCWSKDNVMAQAIREAAEPLQIESLRLYHFPATRSARAKWILYETVGDAFETVVIDLYKRAQYRPEFILSRVGRSELDA
jgi:hypothetical protein